MSGARLQTITAEIIRLDIAFIIYVAAFSLVTVNNQPLYTRGTRSLLFSLFFNNFNPKIMDYFLMIYAPWKFATGISSAGFSQQFHL